MRKEWFLFFFSGISTLCIALLIIRWLAPNLLGVPVDLQLVKINKKIPPFYENIFREENISPKDFLIHDPITKVRAKTLYPNELIVGPHDLLGFRNKSIPNVSDVIVIGDSQTYGNNETIDTNWPSFAQTILKNKNVNVYNMSTGGWGAIQYYYIFKYATLFKPRVIVIAFYTGNDPIDSFSLAYQTDHWKEFRQDKNLSISEIPKTRLRPVGTGEEYWTVDFTDGIKTIFTPHVRLKSNQNHPVIQAGYDIMAKVAEKITRESKQFNIPVVFTIIPTKELVYEKKIAENNINPSAEYTELIYNERNNINTLKERIISTEGAHYIDVLGPLQSEALLPNKLYPENNNGHPLQYGYFIIGKTIAQYIDKFIPEQPDGFNYLTIIDGKKHLIFVKDHDYWLVTDQAIAVKAGWAPETIYPIITKRDIAGYTYNGSLTEE